jgi:hypothetical protein
MQLRIIFYLNHELYAIRYNLSEENRIADSELWDDVLPVENDDHLFYAQDLFKVIGDQAFYTYYIGDSRVHHFKLPVFIMIQKPFECLGIQVKTITQPDLGKATKTGVAGAKK